MGGDVTTFCCDVTIFRGRLDTSAPITPWGINRENKKNTELERWQKQIRPTSTDYKILKFDHRWYQHSNSFETVANAQGLKHLLDPDHVPLDLVLDATQRDWMIQRMYDVHQTSKTKAIVEKHLESKDTRACWKELKEEMMKSRMVEIRSQSLSTFLTSARINDPSYRGNQADWLRTFEKSFNEFNEIMPHDKYSDSMGVRFIQTAIEGTENLSSVIKINDISRRNAGITTPYSFPTVMKDLIAQAELNDNGNRPPARRAFRTRKANLADVTGNYQNIDELQDMLLQSYTSNNHEIQFEEQVPEEDPVDEDVDEIEAFQANFSPTSRPRMDKATWESLSVESRKQWSMIKDADKAKILGYAAKKATFGKPNGKPPVTRGPDGRFQPGRPNSGPRRANQAEIDSLFEDPIESEESNESNDLEAKVHESSFHARTRFSKQTDPNEVHLQDITKQVIKSDPGNIAALLAQTKKVKFCDTKPDESYASCRPCTAIIRSSFARTVHTSS